MTDFASEAAQQQNYKEARKAQDFFRDIIQTCRDGNDAEFTRLLESYVVENSERGISVSKEEVLMEFQAEGKRIVHIAASSGSQRIIREIISCCRDPKNIVNLADEKGFTPIIYGTISESAQVMEALLEAGAEVNARNKDGAAAIHFAAGDGSLERMALLCDRCADCSLISQSGAPLHWAAGKGHTQIIKYLIDRQVDLNSRSENGLPAVFMAAVAYCDEGCEALVRAGADVGLIVTGGLTLLHLCAENGLKKALTAVMETSSGVNCLSLPTTDGNLPIHLAAMSCHREIVELLYDQTVSSFSSSSSSRSGAQPPLFSPSLRTVEDVMEDGRVRMKAWEDKQRELQLGQGKVDSASVAVEYPSDIGPLEPTDPATDAEAIQAAESHKELGNQHFKAKRYEDAIVEYTAAILKRGDSATLWSNRSACYLSMGDAFRYKALRDAEVCRRLDPQWSKGCYRLAAARLALGLYEDAAVAAFEGCKLDEKNEDLKKLLQKSVAMGQAEHRRKTSQS